MSLFFFNDTATPETYTLSLHDALPISRRIGLCNAGVMAVEGAKLFDLLEGIGRDNAKQEYYLSDIVAVAIGRGLACSIVEGEARDLVGIDSRAGLAAAEAIVQEIGRTSRRERG